LKIINADFGSGVHRPAGLGKYRRDMAASALGLGAEEQLASAGSRFIEAALRRLGGRQRKLIEV